MIARGATGRYLLRVRQIVRVHRVAHKLRLVLGGTAEDLHVSHDCKIVKPRHETRLGLQRFWYEKPNWIVWSHGATTTGLPVTN